MNYTEKYNLQSDGPIIHKSEGNYACSMLEFIEKDADKSNVINFDTYESDVFKMYYVKDEVIKIAVVFVDVTDVTCTESKLCSKLCEAFKELDIAVQFTNCANRVIELAKDMSEDRTHIALRVFDAIYLDCNARIIEFSSGSGNLVIKDANGELNEYPAHMIVVSEDDIVYDPYHGYVHVTLDSYINVLQDNTSDLQYRTCTPKR